jgi:ubiquinone/menaquinone biosynthesis C-methylase UbiE
MFNQMVNMGDYFSSGRPVYIDPQIIIDDIRSKISLSKSDVLLDVGCGTGLLTKRFAAKCARVYALDPAERVLHRLAENCRKTGIRNVNIQKGTATDLPFVDCTFDKAVMYAVLHYLEDEWQIRKCIRELIRVCKRGGYVFIGEIPEKNAKQEFESRDRTPEEKLILDAFQKNREEYDLLFKKTVSVEDDEGSPFWIDGEFLLEVAESAGCTARLYRQDIRQPFSLTRRDMVIRRPA